MPNWERLKKSNIFWVIGVSGSIASIIGFFFIFLNNEPQDLKNKEQTIKTNIKEEALQAYNRAIDIQPTDVSAWYNKGITLAALGRNDEALHAFDRAIEIKPDLHQAWYNKGLILRHLEHPFTNKTLQAFDRAIEIKPDYAEAWLGKAHVIGDPWFFNLGKRNYKALRSALEATNKAIEIKPDYFLAWRYKGDILDSLHSNVEAVKAYDKAIEIKPDDAEVWLARSTALWGIIGQEQEAQKSRDKYEELIKNSKK